MPGAKSAVALPRRYTSATTDQNADASRPTARSPPPGPGSPCREAIWRRKSSGRTRTTPAYDGAAGSVPAPGEPASGVPVSGESASGESASGESIAEEPAPGESDAGEPAGSGARSTYSVV